MTNHAKQHDEFANATETHIETINCRRTDALAYEMGRDGIRLTHEQLDEIGGQGWAWLINRFDLTMHIDEVGATFVPRCDGGER